MKKAIVANDGAVSRQIEMTDAAGEENVASCSSCSNQENKNIELMDSLYSAAADGNIKKFEQHSEQLDQILTPYGNTILHIHITARINQNMDFVRGVLEKCPGLLWKVNEKGETLLHMAARHGHADVVEYLLKKFKTTPYHNHHHHDQELGITATRRMLQMTSHEAKKDTALHEAVRYDHLEVVKLLTKEDPTLPYDANKAAETPLYLAAERGYTKVVEEILSTCISPADHGPYSRTSLHGAVINNNEGTTTLLLNNSRIQKSEQDEQGWTPLHFAAHLGYIKILKKLIVDKSAAYKADKEGKTPLHIAASRGKVNIMHELISKCPGCCELVDKRGWNVLHFATKSKNRKAVRLILQNPLLGNLVNEKDNKGNTPFLHAASMRFIITHPKLDLQVFNNDNQNAEDMIDPPSFPPWNSVLDIILWFYLVRSRIKKVRIFMFMEDDHKVGKENIGDPVSSNSNDDGVGKNHLLVATLIATITFAAGFTVPGGFVQEKGPDLGAAILIKDNAFRVFVIFNTVSMILSGLAVFNYLSMRSATHKREIYKQMSLRNLLICHAMLAMIVAFLAGTCAVLHNDKILAIIACVMPAAVYLFTKKFTKPHRQYIQEKL